MPKGKKEKDSRKQSESRGVTDRFLEQGISWLVNAVLGTALLGCGGYLLFQSSAEKDLLNRRLTELRNWSAEYGIFTDIIHTASSGWVVNKEELKHEDDIINQLNDSLSKSLDPTFVDTSLNWIDLQSSRLNSEKGGIQGFVLKNEVEKSCQQDIVRAYELKMNVLVTSIGSRSLRWNDRRHHDVDFQKCAGHSNARDQSTYARVLGFARQYTNQEE